MFIGASEESLEYGILFLFKFILWVRSFTDSDLPHCTVRKFHSD